MTTKAILLILTAAYFLSSCADTEELRARLKKRNERYINRQEQAKMRKHARQERTDAWYDRIMH